MTQQQSNEQTIGITLFDYFRNKGFSVGQAQIGEAAALGNFKVESGFSPTAYNQKEGAQGIAQWEGGRGDSGALGAYAKKTGGSVTSLTTQLGYLETELNGPYARVVTALKTAPNAAAGGLDWAQLFEGNAPASDGQREANADAIYKQIATGKTLTGGGATSSQAATFDAISIPGTGIKIPTPGDGASILIGGASSGVSAAAAGTVNAVVSAAKTLVKPVLGWASNALVLIVGIVIVVIAIKLLADSAEEDSQAPAAAVDSPEAPAPEVAKKKSEGTELAEVAAA